MLIKQTNKMIEKIKAGTTRTCQVTSELKQVSAEVVELHLRRQEDVLRLRQREGALVCAGVLQPNTIESVWHRD